MPLQRPAFRAITQRMTELALLHLVLSLLQCCSVSGDALVPIPAHEMTNKLLVSVADRAEKTFHFAIIGVVG